MQMCVSRFALRNDIHNRRKPKTEEARRIVEKITTNMQLVAHLDTIDEDVGQRRAQDARWHAATWKRAEMNRRAARWNWFAKLDPDLTMAAVILAFAVAWAVH